MVKEHEERKHDNKVHKCDRIREETIIDQQVIIIIITNCLICNVNVSKQISCTIYPFIIVTSLLFSLLVIDFMRNTVLYLMYFQMDQN